MKKSELKVVVIGAGKVGAALHAAARAAKMTSTLHAARKFRTTTKLDCDLLILAVRDKELAPLAEAIAKAGTLPKKAAAVHVAGALSADVADSRSRVGISAPISNRSMMMETSTVGHCGSNRA